MPEITCPTPHISAVYGDFAKTVLMPGDPLRAQFVAQTYLENAVLVNNVRGVQGYTGTYKGVPVSVMASGMGIPSMGIYSWELFNGYGVETILRIGSAGGYQEHVHVRDIVVAMGACTDSNYGKTFGLPGTFAPIADFEVISAAVDACRAAGASYHVGNILSTDVFYAGAPESFRKWIDMGVLAVEMEAAGLYMNAARSKKRALAICTVSDHLVTGEALSAQERQTTFGQMIEIALETAVAIN
jgi:purine-nucleoside phosphorylase